MPGRNFEKILYYSTNRKLKNGFKKNVTFREALFMGQAPDKGLFMPSRIPKFSKSEIKNLRGKPYSEVAYQILKKFLASDISNRDLQKITRESYNFDVPVEKFGRQAYIIQLDKGPTASFKDFAARMTARLMQKLKPKNRKITVLVATSGDTGSAVGEAFRGLAGIRVYILYPRDEVSKVQKKQLDLIGKNVQAIAVDGKFDDCQSLVKEAFSDPKLKSLNLSSANSINISRVLPQIVYYFYAYASVAENFEPVVFSVPSGNFGNALGCEIARRMGLPVKKLVIATNENDEFPVFLKTGIYKKICPSRACLSSAMNVGNPSNLARFFDLYSGILDSEGIVRRMPLIEDMRKNIFSVAITNDETAGTIKEVYEKYDVIIDPHCAVGIAALGKYGRNDLAVCIETADPAKFPELIKMILGISPKMPKSLSKIMKRNGKAHNMPNDYGKLREYLMAQKT